MSEPTLASQHLVILVRFATVNELVINEFGGEGGIAFAPLALSYQHAAARLRWSNRALILNHTRPEQIRPHEGA
jgi:hypothetical protein